MAWFFSVAFLLFIHLFFIIIIIIITIVRSASQFGSYCFHPRTPLSAIYIGNNTSFPPWQIPWFFSEISLLVSSAWLYVMIASPLIPDPLTIWIPTRLVTTRYHSKIGNLRVGEHSSDAASLDLDSEVRPRFDAVALTPSIYLYRTYRTVEGNLI